MTRAASILEKFLSVLAFAVFLVAAVLFTIVYVLVIGVIALVRRCRAAIAGRYRLEKLHRAGGSRRPLPRSRCLST